MALVREPSWWLLLEGALGSTHPPAPLTLHRVCLLLCIICLAWPLAVQLWGFQWFVVCTALCAPGFAYGVPTHCAGELG